MRHVYHIRGAESAGWDKTKQSNAAEEGAFHREEQNAVGKLLRYAQFASEALISSGLQL